MQFAAQRVVGLTLVLAGLGAWWMATTGPARPAVGLIIIAAAAVVAAIPSTQRIVFLALERLRNPSPALRRRVTLGIALVTFVYLIATAFRQDRDLFPKI